MMTTTPFTLQQGKGTMTLLSRFATSATLIAAPFLFAGCQKDDPLPMNQEITGTATKIDLYSPYGSKLHTVTIYFTGDDGKSYTLGLVSTDNPDYEATADVTTSNFLTEASVLVNKFDQRIETHNNKEYRITVNIVPGSEMTVAHNDNMGGYKSFDIVVPPDALSVVNYSFGNEAQVIEMYKNNDKLNAAVEYLLDNIQHSPYQSDNFGKMHFFADLKLQ